MKPTLDFFFYGSIYTYLAVMRVDSLAEAKGLEVRWRPFNLRHILIEQDNTAFVRNATRMDYCWRDVERRARRHGIAFNGRPPYPVDPDLLALRVGVVAAKEGWCPEYTKATFQAWFIDHKAPGTADNIEDVLLQLGKPVGDVLALARSAETSDFLDSETAAARAAGVFGSPNMVIGSELFLGRRPAGGSGGVRLRILWGGTGHLIFSRSLGCSISGVHSALVVNIADGPSATHIPMLSR